MALPLDKLGVTYGGHTEIVDPDRVAAYAAATNHSGLAHGPDEWAPPLFASVVAWGAIRAAVIDVVPAEALPGIVHGEQDMYFLRPLVVGSAVTTWAEPHSVRVGRSGTRYTVRASTSQADGRPVAEQYATLFLRGWTGGASAGPDKPDHAFPKGAERLCDTTVRVDEDQARRYAAASGDDMPIHVDDAFARSVGLPGVVLHGMCTLAMAADAVLRVAAGGQTSRLRRVAARFAGHVLPGDHVQVSLWRGPDAGNGRRRHLFEARTGGRPALSHGLAETDA